MNVYESIKNNIKESDDLKEAVDSCSLSRIKELAGYLQDFIDGCEARGMTELRLPYSHLAGDALAVAGNNGGWITLTEDFSYDYDEVFDEYRVDEPIEDSESIKEDDEERVEISLGNEKRYVKPGSTEESMLNAAKNKLQGLEDRISNLSLFDNKVEVSFDNKATGGFSSTKVTFDKDGKITEVSTNASLIDTDFLSLASELVKRMEDQ